MDKKIIALSFSLQLISVIIFLQNYFFGGDNGWRDLVLIVQAMFTIPAIIIATIVLFILRKKDLVWWHGILISIGSILLSLGIIVLFARI